MLTTKRSFVVVSFFFVAFNTASAKSEPTGHWKKQPTLTAPAAIEAVWKPQSAVFEYRSEGRMYRCDILEYKIKMILRRLGARDRLELRSFACRDHAEHARFEVLMESPVVATEDNIRDIAHYSSEDELIARLRGVELPSPADLQRFPAAWEPISFRRDRELHLEAGDCALVQQLRHQILPRMSVQVTKDIGRVDCSLELTGISSPRLTVLALVPASSRFSGSLRARRDPERGREE